MHNLHLALISTFHSKLITCFLQYCTAMHCLLLYFSDMLIDLCEGSNEVGALCGRILGAGAVLQTAGQRALACREETYTFLSKGLKDEREAVKSAACRCVILSYSY